MKRRISLLFLLLLILLPINIEALRVDKNNLTLTKNSNQKIGLYTTTEEEITEVEFTLVYTTYDVPAYFYVEDGLTDTVASGIVHKITFPEPVSGNIKLGSIKIGVVKNPKDTSGIVNIHTATAKTISDKTINLEPQTINVKIGEKGELVPTNEVNGMLQRIESDIVNITLKDNVFEYSVNIKADIEELDLNPIPKDEYKVEISNQKISELVDDTITITVEDGDKKEEYKIKVNVIKIEDIEVDKSEFESTYKYKGKWITLIISFSVALFIGLLLGRKK